jgi:flagellar biosynthesis GTPase FlhF
LPPETEIEENRKRAIVSFDILSTLLLDGACVGDNVKALAIIEGLDRNTLTMLSVRAIFRGEEVMNAMIFEHLVDVGYVIKSDTNKEGEEEEEEEDEEDEEEDKDEEEEDDEEEEEEEETEDERKTREQEEEIDLILSVLPRSRRPYYRMMIDEGLIAEYEAEQDNRDEQVNEGWMSAFENTPVDEHIQQVCIDQLVKLRVLKDKLGIPWDDSHIVPANYMANP